MGQLNSVRYTGVRDLTWRAPMNGSWGSRRCQDETCGNSRNRFESLLHDGRSRGNHRGLICGCGCGCGCRCGCRCRCRCRCRCGCGCGCGCRRNIVITCSHARATVPGAGSRCPSLLYSCQDVMRLPFGINTLLLLFLNCSCIPRIALVCLKK